MEKHLAQLHMTNNNMEKYTNECVCVCVGEERDYWIGTYTAS